MSNSKETWYNKKSNVSIDHAGLEGLFYIDGQLLFHQCYWRGIEDKKLPIIVFPSGLQCVLIAENVWDWNLQIFQHMKLPLFKDIDIIQCTAEKLAQQYNYIVERTNQNTLQIQGLPTEDFTILYDNSGKNLLDVIWNYTKLSK